MLLPSEIDSINQVRNQSLLSDVAARVNRMSRQNDEFNEYLLQGNRESEESQKAITVAKEDRESPRYKHMPQPAYRSLKKRSDLKVPRQTYLEAMCQSPPSSNFAVQQSSAAAFNKESNYIKNQKWAKQGRQMMVDQLSQKNERRSGDDGLNRSAVLCRSSIMRRSLIIQDNKADQLSMLHSEHNENASLHAGGGMPRQDSLMLPSFSRMLLRNS